MSKVEVEVDEGLEVAKRISRTTFRLGLAAAAATVLLLFVATAAGWPWLTAGYLLAGGVLFLFGVSLILDWHIRDTERAEAAAPAASKGD